MSAKNTHRILKCYNQGMRITGLTEMALESKRFVDSLSPVANRATIVALSGDLGAGKTTFVQGIAEALGVLEQVTSPTFVIEKIYTLEGRQFKHLIHIDAYRLKEAHELEVLGWNEIAADSTNLILIEWPEKVAGLLPDDIVRISFSGVGDSREVEITHV
jgi:tRNA threonylcarbamoyladenosine biosynthesis protein TsaE